MMYSLLLCIQILILYKNYNKKLRIILNNKSKKFENIIKIGRIHIKNSTPLILGYEISVW